MNTSKDLLIVLLLFPLLVPAQNTTISKNVDTANKDAGIIPRKNVFSAGVNYQSRLHYFGRTDQLKSGGLFPTAGYETKIGLYINSSLVFVNNAYASLEYNGSLIEAGYKFPSLKHFSGNVFYNRFLYSSKSGLVQSALKSQTGINLVYNNKIMNLNLGGDAKFSDRTDYGLTVGLDHLFIYVIPKTKKAIAVNPSVYAYAGTQNFTETYYSKNNFPGLPVIGEEVPSQQTMDVTQLNILAWEFSVPVVFVAGKFNAVVTPSYVLPKNLVTFQHEPSLSETGGNMFYITAGIGIRL